MLYVIVGFRNVWSLSNGVRFETVMRRMFTRVDYEDENENVCTWYVFALKHREIVNPVSWITNGDKRNSIK